MKRIYLNNGLTFTITEGQADVVNLIMHETKYCSLTFSIPRSCSLPVKAATNRTKDYYIESEVSNAEGTIIAYIRDAKLQTLQKLTNPFDAPQTEVQIPAAAKKSLASISKTRKPRLLPRSKTRPSKDTHATHKRRKSKHNDNVQPVSKPTNNRVRPKGGRSKNKR